MQSSDNGKNQLELSLSRRRVLAGAGAIVAVSGAGLGARRWWRATPSDDPFNAEVGLRCTLQSPNGSLQVDLEFPRAGSTASPTWQLRLDDQAVLLPGLLGLRLADGRLLGAGAQVIGQQIVSRDESWHPPYGIQQEYPDRCRELTVQLLDASGIQFDILVRVYDEGAALRYRIRDVPQGGELQLSGEATHFVLPAGSTVYASRDEGEYAATAPSTMAPAAHPELTPSCDPEPIADLPVTLRLASGLTAVIAESDRLHYPRLALLAAPAPADALVTHLMRFPGRATGWSGPGDTPAETSFAVGAPFTTPWRVVLVGRRPCDVIENAGLITTLASPNVLGHTGWIRTGRAIRSFRENNTEARLACVDFAVQRKLEFVEFDAHWYGDGTDASDATVAIPELDIEKVIDYARRRDIGVILYVDRMPAMRQLDDIVRTYQAWGVAGIKFGFMWEGRQSDVDWLYNTIKKCGEHRLLVNTHDNLRPAGLERTLPNYVSLEGVRGNEQFPSARHNVTLPFTRNVAGPIDYTICYAEARNQTTNAHQLAMAVVYYSPLTFLYWYDKPAKYRQGQWPELSFFDECPATWDETRALAGDVGEFVVIARRAGERWFVGAMTNEISRGVDLLLDFLGEGRWMAYTYADGVAQLPARNTPVVLAQREVDASQRLSLKLAASGGQAIRFNRI